MFKSTLVSRYIKALVELYGLVHKEKVVEIFNMQNWRKIDVKYMDKILENENAKIYFQTIEVDFYGDYFVSSPILFAESFEEALEVRRDKPFYIPEKKELLKYEDEDYFEVTKEYEELLSFLKEKLGDKDKAEYWAFQIQNSCKSLRMLYNMPVTIFQELEFEDEKVDYEFKKLIADLAYNTRIKDHNGNTPIEMITYGYEEVL